MSRIILTDELLKKAASLSHDRWLRGYDAPEQDEPHEFPPGFYESLLRHANRRRRLKAAFRGAAAAVIALLFAGAILFAASPGVRAAVKNWTMVLGKNRITYYFPACADTAELPDYTISYLPEDFTKANVFPKPEASVFPKRNGRAIVNASSTGYKVVILNYYLLSEDTKLQIYYDKQYAPERVKIRGSSGEYFEDASAAVHPGRESRFNLLYDYQHSNKIQQTNTLYWYDETDQILFVMVSNLEKEEMLHIAEGVILSDPTK